jgi:hypothetical protein
VIDSEGVFSQWVATAAVPRRRRTRKRLSDVIAGENVGPSLFVRQI